MRSIVLISAFCLQLVWCYGLPGAQQVGAFAYQDSAGQRYGGTYGLKDGKVVEAEGNFPPNFQPNILVNNFNDWDYFAPEYFRNLENLLQEGSFRRFARSPRLFPPEPFQPFKPFKPFKPLKFKPLVFKRAFNANLENQRLALNAAKKAFDLTSNQAGSYIPTFNYRFPAFDFPDFGAFPGSSAFQMSNYGNNDYSAFAGAAAVPGLNHQVAAINPPNPATPNVDKINRYDDVRTPAPGTGNYMSVSASSYSLSNNVNGEVKSSRGAETVVNDNGRITKYKVQN